MKPKPMKLKSLAAAANQESPRNSMSNSKHNPFRHIVRCICLVVFCFVFSDMASACPSCKDALASGGSEGGDLVRGYFWSIMFMMSMPFAIVAGFGTSMYVAVRRAEAAEEAERAAAAAAKDEASLVDAPAVE